MQGGFPLLHQVPVAQPGADLCLVLTQRIRFDAVPAHHGPADIEPDFSSAEAACHVVQEAPHLLLVEIHQHAFHNEDKRPVGMLAAQAVHPFGLQQGSRDIRVARLFGYQFAAQRDDFRKVHVIEDRFPVSDALVAGVQSAAYVYDYRPRMRVDEPPHGTVEIPAAHHAAHFAQPGPVELGIIIFQTVCQPFRSLIIQNGMGTTALFRPHV